MLGGVTGKGFMPGQSGNPRGGPRGPRTLTTRLRKIIDQETKDGKDYGDLVMQVLVKAALKGDMKAMSLLLDRVDGKAVQEILVKQEDGDKRINIPGSDVRSKPINAG